MLEQTKAKIYLASERGHTETDWFRSYNTFNFGGYQNTAKQSFENLYVLNDDTLASGKHFQLTVEDDSCIFLLPIVGAIIYSDSAGNNITMEAGHSLVVPVKKGAAIKFTNPYDDVLVNFLHGWIKSENKIQASLFSFSLSEQRNRLTDVAEQSSPARWLMGKYDVRREESYKPAKSEQPVFAFVIQGAFEVQNRLLEARDGLGLWGAAEIEFEALSNDAILLLVELP